jgi:hypothetical protein
VYMSEGLNTTAIYGGGVGANVPMEFVQEVQVKSSSFEAEFGGATGGVVNVIQKRGGPQWHGSLFSYYEGSKMNANNICANRAILSTQAAACFLRLQPGFSTNLGSVGALWADRWMLRRSNSSRSRTSGASSSPDTKLAALCSRTVCGCSAVTFPRCRR